MKYLNRTSFALLSVMLFVSCSDEESNFYSVENAEVLYIDDDKATYSKGELLWLNLKIPKNQEDKVSNSEIDIFGLTGATETFVRLSLFSAENQDTRAIELNPELIEVEMGSMLTQENNTQILGRAIYQNGVYEMRIGIPLETSGNFFLANSELARGNQGLAFNTNTGREIQFSTRIRNSNEEGRFEFTVQE
jgi:hypothetical protein